MFEFPLLRGQLQFRHTREKGGDRDLSLCFRERRAQTMVNAMSEGKMLVGRADDVEYIWVGEHLGIAIACAIGEQQCLPFFDLLTAELNVFAGNPAYELNWAVVAQALRNRCRQKFEIRNELFFLILVKQQRKGAVADQVSGSFVPGDQQQYDVGQQLGSRQSVAALFGSDQCAYEILTFFL